MCNRVLLLFGKLQEWNLHVNYHVNGTTFYSGLRLQTGLSSLRVSYKCALRFPSQFLITTRQMTHLQVLLEETDNHWGKDVRTQKNKLRTKQMFPHYQASEGFFRPSDRAVWLTMLFYTTAHILTTFHFSFPLLRYGPPPSYSFNWCSIFSPHFVGCACSLAENFQSTISHFHNRNANLSKNQTI